MVCVFFLFLFFPDAICELVQFVWGLSGVQHICVGYPCPWAWLVLSVVSVLPRGYGICLLLQVHEQPSEPSNQAKSLLSGRKAEVKTSNFGPFTVLVCPCLYREVAAPLNSPTAPRCGAWRKEEG